MGKQTRSYRLPYGKPRIDTEPMALRQNERIDPVEYMRHYRRYCPGQPVDITKARQMSKADLLAADPRDIEFLLGYISQKQLCAQYGVPLGSITKILREMNVNMKAVVKVEPAKPAADPSPASQAMPAKPESPEFIWVTRRESRAVVLIRENGCIEIGAAVSSGLVTDFIRIGVSRDGSTLKLIASDAGLPYSRHGKRRRLTLKALTGELKRAAVPLPALYAGTWAGREWTGSLQAKGETPDE